MGNFNMNSISANATYRPDLGGTSDAKSSQKTSSAQVVSKQAFEHRLGHHALANFQNSARLNQKPLAELIPASSILPGATEDLDDDPAIIVNIARRSSRSEAKDA